VVTTGDHRLVHLAAQAIRVGHVIRQRCAWCGALIDEHDLSTGSLFPVGWQVNPDGTPVNRWDGLVLVDVTEGLGTLRWAVPTPADGEMPEDSCMALDPAVTS
jgi:hypothetical protein